MLISSTFKTPFGCFLVKHDEHYIFQSYFTDTEHQSSSHPLSILIEKELNAYFDNANYRFNLALKPQGSLYQQKVWNALRVIPVGRTVSYGELANNLQSSPRAIGQACKANPITLFIPCHRVVGKNNPGGYMGNKESLLLYKIKLLKHEATV
jgi:methylated-DNA-[protein]-cysteine S-methyltransferase